LKIPALKIPALKISTHRQRIVNVLSTPSATGAETPARCSAQMTQAFNVGLAGTNRRRSRSAQRLHLGPSRRTRRRGHWTQVEYNEGHRHMGSR